MPTYQYECENCGDTFETLQSMTEPKLTTCTDCGQDQLIRLIGMGSGIIFKGSGFYETDYKKKVDPKPAEKGSDTAKKSEKSETKGTAEDTSSAAAKAEKSDIKS